LPPSPNHLNIPSPVRASSPETDANQPLALLGANSKFLRGVWISQTLNKKNLLSSVSEEELLSTLIELHCGGVVLAQLVAESRNSKFEEISRLEHELSMTTSSLKSALDQVSANESRAVRVEAGLELSNA